MPSLTDFLEVVETKDWFAPDDHLVVADGPAEHLWWTTDSYIANTQVTSVVDDADVDLGIIESDDESDFKIALYPASQEYMKRPSER